MAVLREIIYMRMPGRREDIQSSPHSPGTNISKFRSPVGLLPAEHLYTEPTSCHT